MIRGFADAGKAIIVISSEYAELLAVSDRVLVLRDGVVAASSPGARSPDEESLQLAVQGVDLMSRNLIRIRRGRRPQARPGRRSHWLAEVDWRRYVIYIGFVVVFASSPYCCATRDSCPRTTCSTSSARRRRSP